jgi:hypothetical protein
LLAPVSPSPASFAVTPLPAEEDRIWLVTPEIDTRPSSR